jgi:hypothetical protein
MKAIIVSGSGSLEIDFHGLGILIGNGVELTKFDRLAAAVSLHLQN